MEGDADTPSITNLGGQEKGATTTASPMGIVSSKTGFLGRVLSIYLYSIANSVGYFIHSALRVVLTKLPKADFPKFFLIFFGRSPCASDTNSGYGDTIKS